MRAIAVPTIAAGLNAVLSVIFFTGLSQKMGDNLLGGVILTQSAVALVAIACIPQCWVFLIATNNRDERVARYRTGLSLEVMGVVAGALVVAVIEHFSYSETWAGGLIIYASLVIQGSSSCLGWLRSTESWNRYFFWILGPNFVRVPLIWFTPWLVANGWLPDARNDPVSAMAIYFLAPDLVRWAGIAAPIAVGNYRFPTLSQIMFDAKVIYQNWLYDVGSAVVDISDKVVVGTLLGPKILVAYFFARRIGVVASMVCEPFFAESYRRNMGILERGVRRAHQRTVYKQGIAIAAGLASAMILAIVVANLTPEAALLIPHAVLSQILLFSLVLFVDCMLAANRWSRFLVQLNGSSTILFGVRAALFILFIINVGLFGNSFAGLGLALALAGTWLFEAGYIGVLLNTK